MNSLVLMVASYRHTDLWIQTHSFTHKACSNIYTLKLKNSLTFKITYAFTWTHWHIHCFTQTCSNICSSDHAHRFSHSGIQIYTLRCSHSYFHLHIIHILKIQNVLTWMCAHKHAHIHLRPHLLTGENTLTCPHMSMLMFYSCQYAHSILTSSKRYSPTHKTC